MKHVLFVCTQNRVRSLTAEHLFQGRNGWQTASAGISAAARVELTEELIGWADLIVFMEQGHQDYVSAAFPNALAPKGTACLDVRDLYHYGESDLKTDLETKMKHLLRQ